MRGNGGKWKSNLLARKKRKKEKGEVEMKGKKWIDE